MKKLKEIYRACRRVGKSVISACRSFGRKRRRLEDKLLLRIQTAKAARKRKKKA